MANLTLRTVWRLGVVVLLLALAALQLPNQATVASAQPTPSALGLTKTASPTVLEPSGGSVIYEVVFSNDGDTDTTLQTITDTLPIGFEFGGLAYGSEITVLPSDSVEPEIVWTGPFSVPADDTLTLRYVVFVPGVPGEYVNSVVTQSDEGIVGPVGATVTVETDIPPTVYLPMIALEKPLAYPLPWTDDFANGVSSEWQLFLNHKESPEKGSTPLTANLWIWGGDPGVWGVWSFDGYTDLSDPYENWALAMFEGRGAEEWTDYRLEVNLKDVKTRGSLISSLTGIWFRGTHVLETDMGGGDVTGYYLHIKPRRDPTFKSWVYLWRIPPDEHKIYAAEIVASKEYPAGPGGIGRDEWYDLRVDVVGNRIRCYLKPATESDYELVIDWTDPDSTWMKGTVGFSTYATTARYNTIHVEPLQ